MIATAATMIRMTARPISIPGYIWALTEATVIALGVFVLTAGGAAALVYVGVTGYHSRFDGKHDAILRDLTRQGFRVESSDVYARGGNRLYGTEADLRAGPCIWSFYATKVDGTWKLTLPRKDGNGVVVLSPAAVANLERACG